MDFIKTLIVSCPGPLMKISCLSDKGRFLERAFVGLCEVFVCLRFLAFSFSLTAKLIGAFSGHEFFKNVDFFVFWSLNEKFLLKGPGQITEDSFCKVV